MSLDVACAELGFLDLTFAGLDGLPGPGEERHARALLRSPGGGATTAVACARLGLAAALASPLGADEAGDVVRAALDAEGVRWTGRLAERTAVTVVLPHGGERAMATVEPAETVRAEHLAEGDPAAVVVSLPRLGLVPAGARAYVTCGDAEARAGVLPPGLRDARALVVNAREAALLTGAADPAEAALRLGEHVPTAVVTRGADGAVAVEDGALEAVEGIPARAVDTTGAGDVFTATWVWADLAGLALRERLRWSVLHAARSTEADTAVGGVLSLQDLASAGAEIGLAPPVVHASVPRREQHP